MYIVIEGQDGAGKDTQANLLAEYLRSQGKNVVHYAESGTASTDPFTAEIARLNYGSHQNIDNHTRVLLYLVNRYNQWHQLAEPALKNNDYVLLTRNWLSTLIYEGYGAGVSRELIIKLHKLVMPQKYFHPDKIVIMTLSDAERKKRAIAQGKRTTNEVWKSKNDDFHKKLNNAYLAVSKKFDIPTFDASGTPEEVNKRLKKFFQI